MYKSVGDNVFVGSCPYCGSDSYKYPDGEKTMFLCHGCQRNMLFERIINGNISNISGSTGSNHKVQVNFGSLLDLCSLLDDLPDGHPCVQYVRSRAIDPSRFNDLYYTEHFGKICQSVGKDVVGDRRLILPFFTEDGELFAMQGRALDDDGPRYVTIVFDKDEDRLFGRDRVDLSKPFPVVEGPIDSLFLNNSLAMAGVANLSNKYRSNAVICLDNEPRNPQIVRRMKKFIDDGFKIVIWPKTITEKDINDMVLKGTDVNDIVSGNTFEGLSAKINLNNWMKVNV